MSNNVEKVTVQNITFSFNPWQTLTENRIVDETAHVEGGVNNVIIPRCAPFHPKNVKVRIKGSGKELSLERGEISFCYPFRAFLKDFSKPCWGGIVLPQAINPTDVFLEYDTIGGGFVLNDIAYAKAVADVVNNPRTTDWSLLDNLPTEWPPVPHPHPISDTYNYADMTLVLMSYIDAIASGELSVNDRKILMTHIKAPLQEAHKGTLADLSIKHLEDLPIAKETDYAGNSGQILTTIKDVKALIAMALEGK